MTSDDAIPDREQLRHAGDRRTRRSRLMVAAVAVGLLLLTPAVLLIADHGSFSTGEVIVIVVVPVALGLTVGLGVLWLVRRRPPAPLVTGANRVTRRAVWRAIRTDHAPDARTDELAREAADNTMRNSWVVVFWSIIVTLQLVLLATTIITGNTDPESLVFRLAGDIFLVFGLVVLFVTRSRSRRYLRTHPFVPPEQRR